METANHVSAGGNQDAEVVVTMTEGEGFPQDIHKEDKGQWIMYLSKCPESHWAAMSIYTH